MKETVKLPIGIENFEEIRTEGFYYVDKTGLIAELLNNWSKVNLFTRPRRFGKSLNMSMLKFFFEYGCDSRLFEGLKIAEEKQLCEKYMGQFPVISISLKDSGAKDFVSACSMLRSIIGNEAMRFQFLKESGGLTNEDKARYDQLIKVDVSGQQGFIMALETLTDSLQVLSGLLQKHYGKY